MSSPLTALSFLHCRDGLRWVYNAHQCHALCVESDIRAFLWDERLEFSHDDIFWSVASLDSLHPAIWYLLVFLNHFNHRNILRCVTYMTSRRGSTSVHRTHRHRLRGIR